MDKKKLCYVYGPVHSWRLGRSLGIDPLSQAVKICAFDCVYCQLGPRRPLPRQRRVYVPTQKIIDELKTLSRVAVDHVTFSGRGEPTQARNLGALIRRVKRIRTEPVAVITNATLMHRPAVRRELAAADVVLAKLDAGDSVSLRQINRPHQCVRFAQIVRGITQFRRQFKGMLVLQIMFVPENISAAASIARIARGIGADRVQLNTPLRPSGARCLVPAQMRLLKETFFRDMPVSTVYDHRRKSVRPLSSRQTRKRRGSRTR